MEALGYTSLHLGSRDVMETSPLDNKLILGRKSSHNIPLLTSMFTISETMRTTELPWQQVVSSVLFIATLFFQFDSMHHCLSIAEKKLSHLIIIWSQSTF